MTLKIGDKVGEYTLAKILSDRISLEAPGDTFEVLLYDARMPKKRMEVKTETKPAAVTSSLPSEAPKTASSVAEKPRAPVQEKVSTPAPAPTPQVPRPILRSRRGRMMYSPSPVTPTTPATPGKPAAPAPIQETEEED
jgi:hypothetical protein